MILMKVSGVAQTNPGNISGTVTDHKKDALPGITLLLEGTNKGAATDTNGRFEIKGVTPGIYNLVISGVGYKNQIQNITLEAGQNLSLDFQLEQADQRLNEVVFEGQTESGRLERTALAVNAIDTRAVKLKTADLGEVMARTEGVSVQRAGGLGSATSFALNGLSGDKIRFFYGGTPLEFSPYSFGIANIPINAISRVEVYKGVVPIQFGSDALGGAVNLVSPNIFDGWSGSASYQVGSFSTHQATVNLGYSNNSSGLFISFGGFYDFTKNNYWIDVAIPNNNGRLFQETVRRFHDGYEAFGTNFKIGIREKKWANELSLESYYGSYYKEVQNSQAPGLVDFPDLGINKAVAGNPFGDVIFTSFSQGVNLNYNVNFSKKWMLDVKSGYNYNERVSKDVSFNLYNWYGEVIRVKNLPGEFGNAEHLITKSRNFFARQQIGYSVLEKHSLNLSIAPTHSYRTGDDLLIDGDFDPALDDGYLFDFVTGLEYAGELFNDKLQIITFAKNYRQKIRIESLDPSIEGLQIAQRSGNNYGGGSGLRYAWNSQITTKLSYEYAYRLPRQDEIFGDGQLTGKSLELLPENSHNLNLQWSINNKPTAKTDWNIQGNFFLRKVNDLIFLVIDPIGFGIYQNVWSANSEGIELSGNIKNLVKGLSLNANTTYQAYFNTSEEGPFSGYKGDRIPNTPYFFANFGSEYQLNNILQRNDIFSVFWNTRYVHPFYIGWESAGLQQFKAETPSQLSHSSGITQKMFVKDILAALTIEVQNLNNAKIFDFFGIQRPGRAFYAKITVQF